MRAASDQGMIGSNYVWGGFDIFGSSVNANSDPVTPSNFMSPILSFQGLIDIFEGTIATNVKFASVTNSLFLDFVAHWSDMYDNNEINLIPWEGETNVLSVMPYTAQTCNAFFAECTVPFAP